jgi:hypothetical protein
LEIEISAQKNRHYRIRSMQNNGGASAHSNEFLLDETYHEPGASVKWNMEMLSVEVIYCKNLASARRIV